MDIKFLGWDEYFQAQFAGIATEGCCPARIIAVHRGGYRIAGGSGEFPAKISGEFRYRMNEAGELPVVGDWVSARIMPGDDTAVIRVVLRRKAKFSRKTAGAKTLEQVVAANMDTIFIVSSLNRDFNIRRLERYLILAGNSGAAPVILLNKADICPEKQLLALEAASAAGAAPVHVVSARTGEGLDAVRGYCASGRTAAFRGSSGVGKSTLVNRLAGGEIQRVQEIREDDDGGRHTTCSGRLLFLPSGGMVIDTPGMRELQLWDSDGFNEVFDDIAALAEKCRFGNCRHDTEPGCAVSRAVNDGTLDPQRLQSYRKLQKELAYMERKQDVRAMLDEKKRVKRMHRAYRQRAPKRWGGT